PRQLNPSVPAALERICRKALAADPARRYPSADALRDDLLRYLRRPWWLALAAAAAAGLLLAGLLVWLAAPRGSVSPSPPPAPPLTGELVVRLWDPKGQVKRGLRVEDPGALPVRSAEWVRLEGKLNQPAYVYLLWLDGRGEVTPLYPWNDERIS